MLEIKNLEKSFAKFRVFEQVSFTLKSGSILGLIGINGAGKSTLLRTIAGVYEPNAGEVLYEGEITYNNAKAKEEIFFLPDELLNRMWITPKEIKAIYAANYPKFSNKKWNELMDKFQIDPKKRIYNLSKGMKRRVFVALALATNAKLILFDEAFDGLDPLARLELKKELINYVETNEASVIISSHSLRELEDFCDSYAILDNHQLKSFGEMDDALDKFFKLQVVYETLPSEAFFKALEPRYFSISGRVVTIVFASDYANKLKLIEESKPLLIDELPMNFEDFFIYSIKGDEK